MGAIGILILVTLIETTILVGAWMVCLWYRSKPTVIDDETGTKDTE